MRAFLNLVHFLYLEMAVTKRKNNGTKSNGPKRFKQPTLKFPRQELKFQDTPVANNVVAATGEIFDDSIVEIDQGTGESNRVGRKVIVRKISLRYNITLPTTTTAGSMADSVRFMVIIDKQCNGATATVAGVLEDSTIFGFNNLSNKGRFRVLMDDVVNVAATAAFGNGTTNASGQVRIHKSWHSKNLNIPIEYSDTGNAIADITSNNIFLLAVSEQGVAQLETNARVRYTDS